MRGLCPPPCYQNTHEDEDENEDDAEDGNKHNDDHPPDKILMKMVFMTVMVSAFVCFFGHRASYSFHVNFLYGQPLLASLASLEELNRFFRIGSQSSLSSADTTIGKFVSGEL